MINQNLKFMKSKEIKPYEFYFIDELLFQELLENLQTGGEQKIETIGLLRDFNYMTNESDLILDGSKIRVNFSRIQNYFKYLEDMTYIIYGVLKVKMFNFSSKRIILLFMLIFIELLRIKSIIPLIRK
jgi:hypothetical protein